MGTFAVSVLLAAIALVVKPAGPTELSHQIVHIFGDLIALLPPAFVLLAVCMADGPYLLCLPIKRYKGNA